LRQAIARRLSLIGFALAAVLLVIAGGAACDRLAELRQANRWVEHTLTVQASLAQVLSLLSDAETGQRGFLLTGQSPYLEPYDAARTRLPQELEQLRRLTRDNPSQQERIASLEKLSQQKLAELSATITARANRRPGEAARIVLSGEGRRMMDEIRAVVVAMHAEEGRLLTERTEVQAQHGRHATLAIISSLALALVIVAAAVLTLSKVERERDRERAARTTAEEVAAAIALSEERLKVTLASIGDGVLATDTQGRITLLNGVAEALTGWTEAEAVGRGVEEVLVIVNEESRRPAEQPIARVLREGMVAGLANHTVLIARDGRETPVDDSAAPIKGKDQRIVGVVMVFRDITGRKRAEGLERAARREAEEANRSKDEFLAMLSHELRTPLNSILGWARLLRDGQTTPKQRERALLSIERNAQHQTRLIEDLLDVSRIVSGKLTLEVQRVDLATVIDAALDLVRAAAESAGVEIVLDLHPSTPPMIGDPARLQQIVLNLIANAVKYTQRGGRVEIRLHQADASVELVVRDTGIGIRPDFMPHLFDRFRQDEAGARAQGGLGIGLTIVRHLVERHGGTIRAASAGEGQGSTFTVRLPINHAHGQAAGRSI
jgi:PAS domain S-box-containing protein